MIRKLLIIFMAVLALSACSKKKEVISEEGTPSMVLDSEMSQRESTKYLAYEHYLSIDINEEELIPAYKMTLNACVNDKENNCTILDSKVSSGKYVSAYIKLRIKPKGVKGITEIASATGSVISESTHVEDLALPRKVS